jgi:type IV pilus assembly protein PilC
VLAIVFVAATLLTRSPAGRQRLLVVLESFPLTRPAMYKLSLSRFISALAVYSASGLNSDDAMQASLSTVTHTQLREKVIAAYSLMINSKNPRSLVQAFNETEMLDAIYVRMLVVASRSGSMDETLAQLASVFFSEAIAEIDEVVDSVEPLMAAFLTLAVGATLIAVMLPLVGIMGSVS